MGIFTNFSLEGYTKEEEKFYSPGALYEVMSKLGEELKPDEMRRKVKTLLNGWFVPANSFREQGNKVPAYALEMHAVNEKNNPHNGYGTYIFVPDEFIKTVVNPVTSIFSEPQELDDDEDQIKVLSALYSDGNGLSTNEALTIYELSCTKDEFYPINLWNNEFANDPLEELFGVFDSLKPGEFAGLSLIVIPPEEDYDKRAKMRIRYIEDPEYEEEVNFVEAMRRIIKNENLPEEEVERLAGYKKQQLSDAEKREIDAIYSKTEHSSSAFRCTLRVYGSNAEIAKELADLITRRTSGKWNSLTIVDTAPRLLDLAMRREGSQPFLLCDDEIASIWHVPAENTIGRNKHKPLPAALTPPDDLITIDVGAPGDIQKLIYSIL